MSRSDLVVVGMSGNLLEIFEYLEETSRIRAILDDNSDPGKTHFEGIPVFPLSQAGRFAEMQFLCLIGSERSFRVRREIIASLGLSRESFATIVHHSARVSRFSKLGHGTCLYDGVTVTSNAEIGDHVLILPNAVIHHDVVVGSHSLLGTGCILAGGVRIGDSCYLGSGSAIRPGVTIGDGALVGMGAVVVHDVVPGAVVAGVPARPL